MTTPRTCPHCHEPVEAGHSFCSKCGNDLPEPDCSICGKSRQWNGPYEMPHWCGTPSEAIDTSAPLSLLGENPQVYGSMGAYYREPDEPIDRSKYPTLLSDPRVKQREAPGTPIDRQASAGEGPCPLAEPCHLHPRRHEPREPPAPASPPRQTGKLASPCKRCGTMFDTAAIGFTCEDCGQKAERIAAAQQSVVDAAKAWRAGLSSITSSAIAESVLYRALTELAEAEKTK